MYGSPAISMYRSHAQQIWYCVPPDLARLLPVSRQRPESHAESVAHLDVRKPSNLRVKEDG
jgi:hypothetical protein